MKFLLSILLFFTFCSLRAQKNSELTYTNAGKLTLVGKSEDSPRRYERIDSNKYSGLPARVAQLLTQAAGLAVSFKTNSPVIAARWCVSKSRANASMVPTAQKGVDLYIKNGNKWQFAGIGKVNGQCNDEILIQRMNDTEKECLLYLPLYDSVDQVEIGIAKGASLTGSPDPFKKKVLIYGSSIVQGTGASRPGMAYPARLTRATGINFINLGLSGSAKMEPEVADMVAAITADAYILDCVPNTNPELITERTAYLINTIRKKHPSAPIIVMQSLVRETGYWDKTLGGQVKKQNMNVQTEVLNLLQKGMKNLYFITSENMIGDDHDGTIDGTHPSDLGYDRMIKQIQPQIMEILSKHGIK
ncbi:SGNH/GDSL hydrolase family protein [Pedobacter sp. BMA]|uniref:SGNH/GDSL hydrolase family protein n=1 Tax=Pedobacter sp. BMA TaxID=1663685 RepID=UPI000649BB6B|nr:SGNH/GDSL hydrolase family protein [Pedobacter sp. BMA]KLT64708.1 hydrolase [Pedobacter sp. BMA]